MNSENVSQSDLFKFDYLKCLRSEFAKNECRICIDLCPEGAMVFDRGKLTLDIDTCTACSACIGSCPTEALMSEIFDPNHFSLVFSKELETLISCKKNLPCIASLSSQHLISIALRKSGEVVCDLSHCFECSINKDNRIYKTIISMIDEANNFLKIYGSKKEIKIETKLQNLEIGRRGLFKKLIDVAKEINEETSMTELMNSSEEKQPLKRILLKNALKLQSKNFPENTELDAKLSFVKNKNIDDKTCTNCQECVMFCPTDALSPLWDNTGILFQMGKCISCSICDDICQPGSIKSNNRFDLLEFAFDKTKLLVKHRLEICKECKVAFPYQEGEKICIRCRDFRANYSELFTMAKDME